MWSLGRDENSKHTYPAYIVKSNSGSTRGKRHTLRSKLCKCVEFGGTILLCLIWSLAFIFETWLAYFSYEPSCAHHFFQISWDLHVSQFFSTLWDLHVSHFFQFFGTFTCPIFFNSFCIAFLSLSRNMLGRSYFRAWSIYVGGDGKHVIAYS